MISYYTAIWAICYAEAIHEDVYLPTPGTNEFTGTVEDVLDQLASAYPDICFDSGISKNDILHNAYNTQTIFILQKIEDQLRDIETFINTTGTMAPTLRSYLRYLRPIHPDFRFSGDDGALTELKNQTGLTSAKSLAKSWLRNVKTKLEFLGGSEAVIIFPNSKQSLMPSGLVNEKTYFSGMSVAMNLRNLSSILIEHHQSGIFNFDNEKLLHQSHGDFYRVYRSLQSTYEIRMDHTRVCGFDYVADWVSLLDSIKNFLEILRFCYYNEAKGSRYGYDNNVQSQRVQRDAEGLRKIRVVQRQKADHHLHL